MPEIHTVQFVNASDVIPSDIIDEVSEHGNLTFGDANWTLVSVNRLVHEINGVVQDEPNAARAVRALKALPAGVYINLEF